MTAVLLTCPVNFGDRRLCHGECCRAYNEQLKDRGATQGRCASCKHWDEKPADAPWAGLPELPNFKPTTAPKRALELLGEHVCHRFGGFSSAGGFGASPFGADGHAAPKAYMLSQACSAQLVTAADFGCREWERR